MYGRCANTANAASALSRSKVDGATWRFLSSTVRACLQKASDLAPILNKRWRSLSCKEVRETKTVSNWVRAASTAARSFGLNRISGFMTVP